LRPRDKSPAISRIGRISLLQITYILIGLRRIERQLRLFRFEALVHRRQAFELFETGARVKRHSFNRHSPDSRRPAARITLLTVSGNGKSPSSRAKGDRSRRLTAARR
jgi:hypothetical protein